MKKLVLIFALVASVATTKAWTGVVDGASTLIARKYMTSQALAEFDRISSLKETVDYKWVALGNTKAHLTSDLQSTTTCDKDVVVRIEKAVEILRQLAVGLLCHPHGHSPPFVLLRSDSDCHVFAQEGGILRSHGVLSHSHASNGH